MTYLIIKSLHIIFMVSYFSGLFYTVRIFVYYKDTDAFKNPKKEILREQYSYMSRRLWNIIVVPGSILMLLFGLAMIYINPVLLKMHWFHLKIMALIGLCMYHYWSWKKVLQLKKLKKDDLPSKNLMLRQANEISTFILFFIVFTVTLKYTLLKYWWQLSLGFIGLIIFIILVIKLVNNKKN